MQIPTIVPAPEVVLENPSDSDSSRRVSQLSQLTDYSPTISSSNSISKFKQSMLTVDIVQDNQVTRRASHAGELLSPNNHLHGSHLDVPQFRERNCSLPCTILTEELYIMRSFSVSGRKVVNQGDSVCSRRGSRTSVSSRGSRYLMIWFLWVLEYMLFSLDHGDTHSTPSNRSGQPTPRYNQHT